MFNLEDTCRTIFVEGDDDKRIYSQFLRDLGIRNVQVIPIDLVEIELPEVQRVGAGSGNRARVIELACNFEENNCSILSYRCVADADLGFFLPLGPSPQGLIYTEVTALELYYWCSSSLQRFLGQYAGCSTLDGGELLNRMLPTLQRMFALRLAVTERGLPLSWIAECPCHLLQKDGTVSFDWKDFCVRILNKSGSASHAEAIQARTQEIFDLLQGDPRQFVHGHDFLDVLRFYLLKSRVDSSIIPRKTLFRVYSLCKASSEMANFGLFQQLLKFCRS